MSNKTLSRQQIDAADELVAAGGTLEIQQHFQRNHASGLARAAGGSMILVAHVKVGDETLIVKADRVNAALVALHGAPVVGMRCSATIVFDAMTSAEFAALPHLE
jgi:hypothetical protein